MLTGSNNVKIIGIGGAGCNCIKYLATQNLKNIELIMANTDKKSLNPKKENSKISVVFLGKGLDCEEGAKGDPELGYKAGVKSYDELKMLLKGAEMVFILAGMGGGTGSGASVVVAELARKIGAITLALVTMPFYFEGSRREDVAKNYLEKLEQLVDGMAIMPNNSLLQTQGCGKDFNAVLQTANYYFEDIIQTLSHLFQQKRKFLCDFIKRNDLCFIGTGKDWGVDGLINGVKGAINSLKMLNNIEMGEIKHILTVIAKKKLNGSEDDEVINALIEEDKIVDVVWIENKEMEDDEVKVVVLGV